MAVNRVVYNGRTLIDLTGDTVTADQLKSGATAHDKSGNVIVGEYEGIDISEETAVYTSELDAQDDIIDQIAAVLESQFAVPSKLQVKTITPSTSEQIVTADGGYEALSTVTVEAIPQSYTNQIYQNGYNEGNEVGYSSGYETGYETGYNNGNDVGYSSGYNDGYDEGYDVGCASVPVVKSITTSGDYDSAEYHGDQYAAINSDGYLLLSVDGGTSTSYEAIQFATGTLPSGVNLVNKSSTTDTTGTSGAAYVAIFSGVTFSVNIALNFSGVNSSNDYTTCTVTISAA